MQLLADRLSCIRGGREVFADVSFSVSGGQALMVTGANGAGKSSLLRVVAGLVRVSGGRFELQDGDPELTVGEQSHYLGHLDTLKPALSVSENLRFWSSYLGGAVETQAALEAVDLAPLADLPAAYLSAGQRRRLSIARLVAVSRPVWLLDEPTNALDTQSQIRLAALMRAHLDGGGILVAASHGPIGLDGAHSLRLGPA